jgi:hypothetical protein
MARWGGTARGTIQACAPPARASGVDRVGKGRISRGGAADAEGEGAEARAGALAGEGEPHMLRVVTLADGETVHNAFFDRSFREET